MTQHTERSHSEHTTLEGHLKAEAKAILKTGPQPSGLAPRLPQPSEVLKMVIARQDALEAS